MEDAFEYLESLVGDVSEQLDYDQLRTVFESDIVKANKTFFSSIEPTYQELLKFSNCIKEIQSKRKALLCKIKVMNEKSKELNDAAKYLVQQRIELDKQTESIEKFIERYQLNSSELNILKSTEVNESTLALLERIDKILNNCQNLKSEEHQEIKAQIVKQMSEYQDTLFEKIHSWANVHWN